MSGLLPCYVSLKHGGSQEGPQQQQGDLIIHPGSQPSSIMTKLDTISTVCTVLLVSMLSQIHNCYVLILQHEDLKLQENHTTLLTHSYISLQQLLQCVVITYKFPSLAVFNQYLGNLLLFFKIKSYCSKVTGLLKMYKAKIPLRC